MSIEYSDGDIFESGCQALVCPVNCVGVMGKGLALEFKKRWPDYYENYKMLCDTGRMRTGVVTPFTVMDGRVIFSFPTKNHWRDKSLYHQIDYGLGDLCHRLESTHKVGSLAIPALGCGLGGLRWGGVKQIIEKYLDEKYLGDLDCRVVVFPPKEDS